MSHCLPGWSRRCQYGKREGDDLACIARVSQDFLVACDRSIEADFADRASRRANTAPRNYRAIVEHETRRQRYFGPRCRMGGGGGAHLRSSASAEAPPELIPRRLSKQGWEVSGDGLQVAGDPRGTPFRGQFPVPTRPCDIPIAVCVSLACRTRAFYTTGCKSRRAQ